MTRRGFRPQFPRLYNRRNHHGAVITGLIGFNGTDRRDGLSLTCESCCSDLLGLWDGPLFVGFYAENTDFCFASKANFLFNGSCQILITFQ